MEKYRWWDIMDDLPPGWVVDNLAGSPLHDCVFITNGKSAVGGQERALLRLKAQPAPQVQPPHPKAPCAPQEAPPRQPVDEDCRRALNRLSREQLKTHILKDIMIDLKVCELEGWDKLEYLRELQEMITTIGVGNAGGEPSA